MIFLLLQALYDLVFEVMAILLYSLPNISNHYRVRTRGVTTHISYISVKKPALLSLCV